MLELKNYLQWMQLIIGLLLTGPVFSQIDMARYEGGWAGEFSDRELFDFEVSLKLVNASGVISITNGKWRVEKEFPLRDNQLSGTLAENLEIKGTLFSDQIFSGFIQSGVLQYHFSLEREEDDILTGHWRPLMLTKIENPSLFLSVENASDDTYEAYPIFGDNRFTGTWCGNFQKEGNRIDFQDIKTGLHFTGILKPNHIELQLGLGGQDLETISLKKREEEFQTGVSLATPVDQWINPPVMQDGWLISSPQTFKKNQIQELQDSIQKNVLTYPHAILAAQNGKLVFEAYFGGYQVNIPHDQRSASKSVSSALIGIAIDQGVIRDETIKLYDLLPNSWAYTFKKYPSKAEINLKHLLTMSSGLDAIDFGLNRNSVASENNYQQSPDWLKTVLEAPMIEAPGTLSYYGTANPFLLGVALDELIEEPLALWMDRHLLAPLGITNYIIQNDGAGKPYFGGGMYLTPRDMLKFGQLYLNNGKWNDKQILSKDWVEKSFQQYFKLDNTLDKNEYGYLWWHKTYRVGERTIRSVEARGSGGQYIMIMPELELVVVMTSGNYRNGRFQQPELILEKYLLPAILRR